jgi:hypothetical protein
MDSAASSTIEEPDREAPALRLMPGRREMAAIVAFWSGYELLTLANRFFDPGIGGIPYLGRGRILVAAGEALCWSVLTPIIFVLAGRIDFESHQPSRRWSGLLLVTVVAVAAAGVLAVVGFELRDALGWLRRVRAGRPPGMPGPGLHFPFVPLWFPFLNSLVLALGVVAAGIARAYSRRLRSRREQAIELTRQLAEARLDALRRQLDPHFLFNTLNAISSLVERDPRGVRRMIARLGDLLRYNFEGGDAPEVPLRRELALLGLYVDIVRVRFGERLSVSTHVEESVLDALVPPLILQPLVENAVKHGVERRPEGGAIVVEAAREGTSLVLRVVDDGPDDPLLLAAAASRSGVGIRNTRERLRQLYGDAQRFTLGRDASRGVVAEIRLPYHLGAPTTTEELLVHTVTGEHHAAAPGGSRAC